MTIIAVEGEGTATAPFDSATFEVSIKKTAASGPEAKEATREVSKVLQHTLKTLQIQGLPITDQDIRTRFDLHKASRWDAKLSAHVFDGYTANYVLQLTIRDFDYIAKVHDALTSIMGAEVNSPVFEMHPDKREELRALAFDAAFSVANRRFKTQAAVIGLQADHFEVVSWSVRYSKPPVSFKTASLNDDDDGTLNLSGGMSKVSVSITVNFAKINAPTP